MMQPILCPMPGAMPLALKYKHGRWLLLQWNIVRRDAWTAKLGGGRRTKRSFLGRVEFELALKSTAVLAIRFT